MSFTIRTLILALSASIRCSARAQTTAVPNVQDRISPHGYLKNAAPRMWQSIPPLLCRDQLPELANKLGLTGVAAEIGVYKGEFSATVLKRWNGEHYWMIDAWEQRTNDTKRSGAISDNNGPTSTHVVRYNRAERNTRMWSRKRTMLRAYSIPAAKQFPDGFFDWIYVDALHTREALRHDLEAWWPKLKMGGMLSGDDYADEGDPGYGPKDAPTIFSWGVRSAVNSFAHQVHEQVYTSAGNNFFHAGPPVVRSGCHEFQAWYFFKTH